MNSRSFSLTLLAAIPLLFAPFFLSAQNIKSQELSLAGKWYYATDIADEGLLKKWYLGNLQDQYLGNINFVKEPGVQYHFEPAMDNETTLPNTSDLIGIGIADQSPWINYLQRKHKYIGKIWFQKLVDIPKSFEHYTSELYLERVKWQSRVWVDGVEATAPADGLVTAHRHNLGQLSPGKHLISICVDNRMIHPIGDKGHNYTEQTESIWNGIIGEIKLVRKPKVYFDRVRLFSDLKKKSLTLQCEIANPTAKTQKAAFEIRIWNQDNKLVNTFHFDRQLGKDSTSTAFTVIPKEFELWSSQHPNLYYAELNMFVDGQEQYSGRIGYGNREIGTTPYKILINGLPEFIRGNQEALGYPVTGHPPMDVETWRKIFQKYKDYGLNQVRFHSSTPPEAAFQAADELGIYIMTELIWMTSVNAKKDLRPISATTGIPQGLGNSDRSLDTFVYQETKRLLAQFGNHPSFAFFAFGNEMDNINKEKVNQWIHTFKNDDPRRLYAATTARAVLPNDDFQDSHIVPGHGQVVNNDDFSLITNYDSAYVYTKVPIIAHELGQYPVYPLWSEIDKYANTPFRFVNLEKARQLAIKNHTVQQDSLFHKASGAFQQLLYKSEIERQFRSKYSAGFNLLQMNDYTGQGEALVGWLDAFYDSKGITTPSAFRQHSNKLVVLAELNKRIYKPGDPLKFTFKINNSVPEITKEGIHWQLIGPNNTMKAQGKLATQKLQLATPVDIGQGQIQIGSDWEAGKYTFCGETLDHNFKNTWEIWVYPSEVTPTSSIIVTRDAAEALTHLKNAEKVLLIADHPKDGGQDYASFKPVFWSTLFFPGKGSKTLGAIIDNKHPLFAHFPTDDYLNWNWRDICNNGHGIILRDSMAQLHPLVQPVNDFHASLKIATLLEAQVGKGKLIISGYDLTNDLANRPAAQQLLNSILLYMESDKFIPKNLISESWLTTQFQPSENTSKANITAIVQGRNIRMPAYFHYKEIGKNKFSFSSDRVVIGKLRFRIQSLNKKSGTVNLDIEGRKSTFDITKPDGQWIEVQFFREDLDDQIFMVNLADDTNLTITAIEINVD
ncbi:glycoside hydrolase family 2 TIM barrel-domain containing protein [Sphingobacterium multivorum]|uniref:glycoside hydrolase family 2 TIM barrel-domain containing protein n=1 Tax=Sphingobacterium multivorum TaxID=28454 RepID=UPI0031BB5BD0